MTVHDLFRMAKALFPVYPIAQQETAGGEMPAFESAAAPLPPAPPPSMAFKPSHALYSSVTNRHKELRQYRRVQENAVPKPEADSRTAEKRTPAQEET